MKLQAEIRSRIQTQRKQMDGNEKTIRTHALESRFCSWFSDPTNLNTYLKIKSGDRVAVYRSFPFEIQMSGIENWLRAAGYCVEFPEDLSWDPAVVIVPGVAFSRQGDRIGLGKGFYDRFLAEGPHRLRIALCFDFQLVENCHANPWDQAMDFVVTETEVIHSNRGRSQSTQPR